MYCSLRLLPNLRTLSTLTFGAVTVPCRSLYSIPRLSPASGGFGEVWASPTRSPALNPGGCEAGRVQNCNGTLSDYQEDQLHYAAASFLNNTALICYQKGNKMSLDDRAKLLETVAQTPRGVRELIKKLGWSPSRVTHLLDMMRGEGLIESKLVRNESRGRPKKTVIPTPLGLDFLETHRKLRVKPLRARREDFEHAVRDALYAERLTAKGRSPFELFLELNRIVHNIKCSPENSRPT